MQLSWGLEGFHLFVAKIKREKKKKHLAFFEEMCIPRRFSSFKLRSYYDDKRWSNTGAVMVKL